MDPRDDSSTTDAAVPQLMERALRDGFRIAVIDGPDRPSTKLSTDTTMTIGTDPSCDLVLSCRATSRFHCEIELGPRGAVIRDLESTNGTRVNGVRVIAAYLRRGSEVELGRNRLRFELASETLGLELAPTNQFGGLVGGSVAMRALYARMAHAAASDITVLLSGETGTGKSTAAESIHATSARRDQPFIVVDCASLPEGLAESELFGHAAGAFTGADRDRSGCFEAAEGGTVFLDEIGDLPLALQPKLLRVIERREIQRVGETRPRAIRARIIAASHRDLRRDVNAKQFRADLYFRLAVMPIQIPPLRDRREDLPAIIDALLAELVPLDETRARARRQLNLAALSRMDWPGNVRELRNHVERAIVFDDGVIAEPVQAGLQYAVAREASQRAFDRQYLNELLRLHDGNVTKAARHAGMHRTHLYRLLQRAGLP